MPHVRRFEFSEGSSNKFWEIHSDGNLVFTRYGRIGSDGQVTQKDEGSEAGAQKLVAKLIGEKTRKGYQERPATQSATPAAKSPKPKSPAKTTPAAPVPTGPGPKLNVARALELLRSKTEAEVAKGVELIAASAFHPDVTTDLFAVSQMAEDAEVQKQAKAILVANGTPGLRELLKKKHRLDADGRLAKFCDTQCNTRTGLDAVTLARRVVMHEPYKGSDFVAVGLPYLLAHGDHDAKVFALRECSNEDGYLELGGLKSVPDEVCDVDSLTELLLNQGKVTQLPARLGQLARLRRFEASGQKLTSLPDSLGDLSELRLLDVSENALTALPASLVRLRKLESLNVGHNKLTQLPEGLGGLTNLTYLGLSHNKLAALPDFVAKLKKLKTLGLTNNPAALDVATVKAWKKTLGLTCLIYVGDDEV